MQERIACIGYTACVLRSSCVTCVGLEEGTVASINHCFPTMSHATDHWMYMYNIVLTYCRRIPPKFPMFSLTRLLNLFGLGRRMLWDGAKRSIKLGLRAFGVVFESVDFLVLLHLRCFRLFFEHLVRFLRLRVTLIFAVVGRTVEVTLLIITPSGLMGRLKSDGTFLTQVLTGWQWHSNSVFKQNWNKFIPANSWQFYKFAIILRNKAK